MNAGDQVVVDITLNYPPSDTEPTRPPLKYVLTLADFGPRIHYSPDAPILYARTLASLAAGAKHILELGTGIEQLSTIVLSRVAEMQHGHLWTVDIEPRQPLFDPTYVTYLTGRSVDIPWDQHVDVLYVDSDHDPAYVTQELTKFAPWVWRGGRIIFDDVRHEGAPRLEHVLDNYLLPRGLTWKYATPLPGKIAYCDVTHPIR